MKRSKNLLRKGAALAAMSTVLVSQAPLINAFAYGEADVSQSTFKQDTDNSADFQKWLSNVWQGGEKAYAQTENVALTPGSDAADLNFSWYSAGKGTPAVKVWKDGSKSSAKVVTGNAEAISAENWQGKLYSAANKVNIADYFEENTQYHYQYTDNYTGDDSVWSAEYDYTTKATDKFSVILTGDPQVGASGSSSDYSANDASVARDAYNWNKTMQQALKTCPDASFLLSAGDQINQSGATKDDDKKTRESEYAGYLYPSVFRSLPIAATIGNHDMAGSDYSAHFNNPNSEDKLGSTAAGSDFYFNYGDVLFISLNSNNRNQEEHRTFMNKAVASNPDAKWKVVIFHSDIYGSGQPHADTDAATNRIVFAPLMDEFNIDICLTGHDHTFSRSYQILDGNVVDYDISSGSVTNPDGTLYITTGSGSGSKYYNLLNYTPYYIAERTNACLPSFSTIDFSSGSLTIKTYDYNGNKYADDFTINKTNTDMSVDEVINNAEALINGTEVNYTEASMNSLKDALSLLKKIKAAYTTDKDPMLADIVNNYGKDTDRVSGYGSVKNAADKSTSESGNSVNRFKKGVSTLLDKTIYIQAQEGAQAQLAYYKSENAPKIDAKALEDAKTAVVNAINALTVQEDNNTVTEPSAPAEGSSADNSSTNNSSTDNGKAPQTGDNMLARVYACMAAAAAGIGAVIVGIRKKEDICER